MKRNLLRVFIIGLITLLPLSLFAQTEVLTINSSEEDGFVSNPDSITENNPYTLPVGDKGMKVGRSAVDGTGHFTSVIIPFQLPDVTGKTITDASLKVYVNYGRSWATTNIDLYGLTFRNVATISTGDYYSGDFGTGNGSDVGIADDFFTKNADDGVDDTPRWEETEAGENTALVNYIKAQYQSGAQAGDWIFLRLSVDNLNMPGAHYFGIDDATMTNKPTLQITLEDNSGGNNAPVLDEIGDQTVNAGENKDVNISANDIDGDDLTFTATNTPSFATFTDNGDGTAVLALTPQSGDIGTYDNIVITVTDGTDSDTETISVIVTDPNVQIVEINSSAADGMVYDPSISTVNNPYTNDVSYDTGSGMKLGSSDNGGGLALISDVLVFELPERPAGKIVTEGEVTVDINWKRQWVTGSFDLYGLPFSTSDALSADMHYDGEFVAEQNGVIGLQNNFWTAPAGGAIETPGSVSSSTDASALIASYINAQYDNGAKAGDFVFVRLSPAEDYQNNGNFVFITSGNSSDDSKKPKLKLTFSDATFIKRSVTQSLSVYPNPATNGNFTVQISGLNSAGTISIYSLTGELIMTKTVNAASKMVNVALNVPKGLYLIRLTDDKVVKTTKLKVQ